MTTLRFALCVVLALLLLSTTVVVAGGPKIETHYLSSQQRQTDSSPKDPFPNILFSKTFLNDVFAIGWEIVVVYKIFNVGQASALNVHLTDNDFVNSMFEVLDGQPEFRVGTLVPNANVTFNLTATPMEGFELGDFRMQPATVTFIAKDPMRSDIQDTDENMMTVTSSLSPMPNGDVIIYSKQEADRKFGSKWLDYMGFFGMSFAAVMFPFVFWKRHTRKYEALQRLKVHLKLQRKLLRKCR